MVKLRYFIVALCFLSFVSCKEQQRQRYIEPFKKLDVQKFMENKYKWKALDIKNYSFKYNFDDAVFAKYGREKNCVGKVIVRNGVGTVTFEGSETIPDKNNPDEKCFYITSIDEAFDNFLEHYFKYKKMLEEGKIECLYLNGEEWYDRNYFFLDSLCLDTFWATGIAPREIYFAIKDFRVLE